LGFVWFGWGLLALSLFFWVINLFLHTELRPSASDPGHHWLTVCALFLVVGGLLLGYKQHEFFAEQSRQYERMWRLFRNAFTLLNAISKDTSFTPADRIRQVGPILVTLGREALSENASWLILHRARPIQVPGH